MSPCLPRVSRDLHPVIDLSRLNDHLVIPRFKMETQASVQASIRENEWTVSIDIQDAYLHVPMARSVRKYLRFMVNGRVYQFTCLPFSLATSPWEFTKLLRPVVQLLQAQGIKLHVYLDDWLIRASSAVQARTHADLILQVLQHLGWVINFCKSNFVPSQQFDFIGMQFNTCAYTVAPLPKMRIKIQNTLDHWRSHPLISAWDLHRLWGMLTFMATLVPRGRLRLRPIQWWASEVWCQETGSWSDRISVTPTIRHQVAWWASPAVLQGVSLSALETEITLFTDASSHGWGTQLGSRTLQGTWSPQQASQHINLLRDGSSVSECNSVPASTQVSGSAPDVRQRRGCFVHQQGRRDQIVQTDPPDDSALEILRPEGHQTSACSSSRITQHPGRHSVASGPDSCDGMGHQWPASSFGVLRMENTSDRSVRNFCQQEAACLRITISGPEGQIRRCDVSTVVRDGNGVRLPTIQDAAGCPQQDPQVSQPVSDLNSSTPDVSIMDAGAIRAVSLSSNTTGRASTSYSRSSAAKRSRREKTLPTLKSTRLATLKGLFVKLGYSRHVAERMSTNLRPSSIGCYESHWSRFVEYCRRNHLKVFEVDSRIFTCLRMSATHRPL